jgi:hypothetical protein
MATAERLAIGVPRSRPGLRHGADDQVAGV